MLGINANRRRKAHGETHRSGRAGWLRAAVLGSDDAIVSTASLMIGVTASSASKPAILIAGVAGLVAGSMSMAVGEYVSVSSQRDAEEADIELEKRELASQPIAELHELAMIYVKRGLEKELAMKVARQLSAHDRLHAHMRDELGMHLGRKLRDVRPGPDRRPSRRSGPHSTPRDRDIFARQSRRSRRLGRPSRWRTRRPGRFASRHWGHPRDGCHGRYRTVSRRFCRLGGVLPGAHQVGKTRPGVRRLRRLRRAH
jgi:hypothetical protein